MSEQEQRAATPEVVAALQEALELAMKGGLQSVAIAGRGVEYGDYTGYSTYDVVTQIGLLELAKARLVKIALDREQRPLN